MSRYTPQTSAEQSCSFFQPPAQLPTCHFPSHRLWPFSTWLMTPTKMRPHKPMLAGWTSESLSLSLSSFSLCGNVGIQMCMKCKCQGIWRDSCRQMSERHRWARRIFSIQLMRGLALAVASPSLPFKHCGISPHRDRQNGSTNLQLCDLISRIETLPKLLPYNQAQVHEVFSGTTECLSPPQR